MRGWYRDHPCVSVVQKWTVLTCEDIESEFNLNIKNEPDLFLEELENRILQSQFDEIMEWSTGLPPRLNRPLVHTVFPGPIVLEITHISELGVSAFTLEEV